MIVFYQKRHKYSLRKGVKTVIFLTVTPKGSDTQLHKQGLVASYHAREMQIGSANRRECGNEYTKGLLPLIENCPIQRCVTLDVKRLQEVREPCNRKRHR
jgi:hypothetical protein